jgi:hypothetical protein
LRLDQEPHFAAARLLEPSAPFAIAAIEDEKCGARRQPEHVSDIIRLLAAEGDFGVRRQFRVNNEPGRAKIAAWHGFTLRRELNPAILHHPARFCYA